MIGCWTPLFAFVINGYPQTRERWCELIRTKRESTIPQNRFRHLSRSGVSKLLI
ncbi:hypothetical protein RBWH47_00938 [Rhodopirellula baltica WH47]|uniref:Uncharacterized protein n=1 Tax=Rhodopirellula baltica WH47 TaxID=991778 RepID=F2B1L8_RHOBT|nr:hypothetical protein RBWH47_00938 [Rhodopirellula baltica WH47]